MMCLTPITQIENYVAQGHFPSHGIITSLKLDNIYLSGAFAKVFAVLWIKELRLYFLCEI